jgi:hypothetical protein
MDDESKPRARVRKPDQETAIDEGITTTEQVADALGVEAFPADVQPTTLKPPFTRDGFSIVDAMGQRIIMCGIPGDTARTGPGIAEAVLALLNR